MYEEWRADKACTKYTTHSEMMQLHKVYLQIIMNNTDNRPTVSQTVQPSNHWNNEHCNRFSHNNRTHLAEWEKEYETIQLQILIHMQF